MGNLYVRMSRRLEVAQLPKVDFVSRSLTNTTHAREREGNQTPQHDMCRDQSPLLASVPAPK